MVTESSKDNNKQKKKIYISFYTTASILTL